MYLLTLLVFATVFLSTCGMLNHYDLMECMEIQEMQCNSIKVFNSSDLCEKFAKELNIDSTMNIYYCEEKGVFQK
jgi:hypothetical protein